jgi:hypothetical protein
LALGGTAERRALLIVQALTYWFIEPYPSPDPRAFVRFSQLLKKLFNKTPDLR